MAKPDTWVASMSRLSAVKVAAGPRSLNVRARQGVAQLCHEPGSRDAVAGDIADDETDAVVVELEGVVPVTTDLALTPRRHVDGRHLGRSRFGQDGQDGPLQQRDRVVLAAERERRLAVAHPRLHADL